MTKYLRAKTNGFVFEYNDRLAMLPEWEEVTEEQAFPERFAPVDLAKRETKVELTVSEAALAQPPVSPELEAEATRSMNRRTTTRAPRTQVGLPAGLEGAF